jgi:hypothetical protein
MKTYEIGHHAIKSTGYGSFVSGEIVAQTAATVKAVDKYGYKATWRKLDLLAVVPAEQVAGIVERLTSAGAEKADRQRAAQVWHQLEVAKIITGFEA